MMNLLHQKCQAVTREHGSLSAAEVATQLSVLTGWHERTGAIEKTFSFRNFFETMAFVNALAWVCHTEDHHPDLAVSFNRCTVRFHTHSVQGISFNDFICAAKADALMTTATITSESR